ncbi:MAG: NUDIX domain-containing protein [Thermodesulfobacteriota bacterium]|nr:NUDIX domain-containing protein [Thermodesulfobacteriota bacterium]
MEKQRKYCCYCGSHLVTKEENKTPRAYCPECRTFFYKNPLPVASSIVVNDKREVLLVKRKNEPYKDMWCLPIGFAETGEEVRDAALRELREEAGIEGSIIRLIDVDTVDNYLYGALAIVTYEVQYTGGNISPGDDASMAAYFPIMKIPELAWSSNKKAINIYIAQNRDTWSMIDSFKKLFPQMDPTDHIMTASDRHENLLSNVLIQMLSSDLDEISLAWEKDIRHRIPLLAGHMDTLVRLNKKILQKMRSWLSGGSAIHDLKKFVPEGRNLCDMGIPLPDILTSMALSRKTIWMHVVKKRILSSPMEIYTALEFNNRIIFFYDRLNYYLSSGYFQ